MRTATRPLRIALLLALATLALTSCSPYATLSIDNPMRIGNVVINPGVDIGFPL